jgi:prefoldin subunit 5
VYSVFLVYESHTNSLDEIKERVPVLKKKIKRKKKELKELQTYLKDVEEAKKMIEKVALENEKIQKTFPSTINDSENLTMLSSLVSKLNILNLKLIPGDEKNKGFYFTKSYKLKATGTFLQFLILLEKIGEKKERLMNIGELEFIKSNVKNKGRFQLIDVKINLIVYRYNASFKEERGIYKIENDLNNTRSKTKKIKKKT